MAVKKAIKRKKVAIKKPKRAKVKALPKKKPKAKLKKKISLRQSLKRYIKTRRPRAMQRSVPIVYKAPPLQRHEGNPIIEPRQGNFWEMKATFNPGAVYADSRVHLLYRAIGGDDVSVLGYASSRDGFSVDERLDEPAFVPIVKKKEETNPTPAPVYSSGGGWNGGCEDPRLTLIDDKVYLMYLAFDGWSSVRIALASIGLHDFLAKQWNWSPQMLISPPGEVHKNWTLFPEKINGKYAILTGIAPEILVSYVDNLDKFDDFVRSTRPQGPQPGRKGYWDNIIRGAGPPPIKTKLGWLLFYHAMDAYDPNRYKLGAMILDASDPTKVLYRTKAPILEPDEWYENTGWKSGVVYSCGAVVKDGELYVYYGGADSVVCVAMANLDKFVDELKKHGTARLESAKVPGKK